MAKHGVNKQSPGQLQNGQPEPGEEARKVVNVAIKPVGDQGLLYPSSKA